MLVSTKDALARLASPDNLMNKMRDPRPASRTINHAMGLFVPASRFVEQRANEWASKIVDPKDLVVEVSQSIQEKIETATEAPQTYNFAIPSFGSLAPGFADISLLPDSHFTPQAKQAEPASRINQSAAEPKQAITHFPKPKAIVPDAVLPSITTDDILDNVDVKIKLANAHNRALETLVTALETMHAKIDDVSASKLPAVVVAAIKTVESIRKEKLEVSKDNNGREVHYHFYEPARKSMAELGEPLDV